METNLNIGENAMKKTIFMLAMFCILFSTTIQLFAEDPPPCGTLCGVCGVLDMAWENVPNAVTVTSNDVLFPVWETCDGFSTCCANNPCTLYMTQKNVSAGFWTCEAGISLGIQVPPGYSILGGGKISVGGQTVIIVEGGLKSECLLTRCQKSTQKIGPYYHTITRRVLCTKLCYNPTDWLQNNPCSWGQTICKGPLTYYKESHVWYLLDACKVIGTCGLPDSSCPQCADPYNPNCN